MDYLLPCLAAVWVTYFWETYLQWRQRGVYKNSLTVPAQLKETITETTFTKSRLYQLDKSSFSIVQDLYKQIEFLVIIIVGAIPLAWNLAGSMIAYYGFSSDYEVMQSLVFLVVVEVFGTVTGFPWTVYYTFVLEEKHGFNKQTITFFVKDQIKKFILSCILNLSIMSGLISIIKWGGQYFYVYAWLFVLVVTLAIVFIYHDFIAPCFDKYTPLPDGSLRVAIERLASSLNFPLKKLLIVEGSRRSAHSNAYFYGFWKNKCIVLFDTLLEDGILAKVGDEGAGGSNELAEEEVSEEKGEGAEEGREEKVKEEEEKKAKKKGCSTEEVLAVLAHELGHWKLSHNLKNIIITEVNLFFTLFLFGYFMNQQDLYTSFGFPTSRPILIGLILFLQLVFLPYHQVYKFLFIQLTRWFEYQADAFAKGLGHDLPLCSALVKLNIDNLSFPIADHLYSAFHHSHPTLLERLQALQQEKHKTD